VPRTAPKHIERDAGTIRLIGWNQYEPARVPAMWMRVADLLAGGDPDWLTALREYGPLDDVFDEQPRTEAMLRDPWRRTIAHLDEASFLWREAEEGMWRLPDAPIELARGYRRLKAELARVVYDGVQITTRGLETVLEPRTLDASLWLSAVASVRERHRFRRCERCSGWFPIQRTDARFCSAACRNLRRAADDAAAAAAG
jgi:hypothetical protein